MKKMAELGVLQAILCGAALMLVTSSALAESHLTMTRHVPEAVTSGKAQLVGQLPAAQHLSLAISLPLRNENALNDLLEQVYDRHSSSYRHYLSVQEFTERFGPAAADYEAVRQFAQANGLTIVDLAANHIVLDVEGSVANIEKAFQIKMGLYQHPTENRTFYSPDREPSLDLGVSVLHISGLDNFTLPRSKNRKAAAKPGAPQPTGSGPGGQYVASDMRAAYYGSGPLTGTGQTVGLFEFAGYEVSDVQLYFKNLGQPFNVPINGVSLNGVPLKCPPQSCDDSEQVIDIEMAVGMAPGLSQVLVYVGGNDVSIFNQMAVDNVAKTLSCSWGWSDDESSLDPIFKEMAMQGQTVFVASGDDGSGTPGDVVWPADDSYIVSVGGTDINTNGPGGPWQSETGWNGSAGAPSKNGIPIPSYQKLPGVINSLNNGSKTLRNYPDVAAESNTNQYSCYDGSCGGDNGGTSFAAPQWASLIALANQQEVSQGKSTLGFLNTRLYEIGIGARYKNVFHDITSGNNGGYNAVKGYDLVTGWGSPVGSVINSLLEIHP
ncbi:MAG: protease pro-enzyme activation domain-containing protein [Terriglobales bacterium]